MSGDAAPLKGKNILLSCPATFNYDREIAAALERMGAAVAACRDGSPTGPWSKGLVRLAPRLAWLQTDGVHRRWLDSLEQADFDHVLIIKSEIHSPAFIRELRKRYRKATFTLYLWDSIRNIRQVEEKFGLFDRILSFDRLDCRSFPALQYRPLFFLDKYREENPVEGRGVFFVGTLNGDRPRVLQGLVDALRREQIELDYWLFVRSRLELRLRRLVDSAVRGMDPSRLIFRAMKSEDIARRFAGCSAVLDIQHHRQVGLTMRTFEVLASGKKLITTNPRVTEESFFDSSRICVVERSLPLIPKEFLASKPLPLSSDFYRRFSITGWLAEVLGLMPLPGPGNPPA